VLRAPESDASAALDLSGIRLDGAGLWALGCVVADNPHIVDIGKKMN
jgi:hypothetical protein